MERREYKTTAGQAYGYKRETHTLDFDYHRRLADFLSAVVASLA